MAMLSQTAHADPSKAVDSVQTATLSVSDWQQAVAAAGYQFVGPMYVSDTASRSATKTDLKK
jgi:hypothetical protein